MICSTRLCDSSMICTLSSTTGISAIPTVKPARVGVVVSGGSSGGQVGQMFLSCRKCLRFSEWRVEFMIASLIFHLVKKYLAGTPSVKLAFTLASKVESLA